MSSSKISFGAFLLDVTFAFSLKIQNSNIFFALVIHFHLDLNNDGHLSFKDLLWAKDKICFMSGWKIGTEKYNETERNMIHSMILFEVSNQLTCYIYELLMFA